MVRVCPSCGEVAVPSLQIGLLQRPECRSCGSNVGLHWLFAGGYACLLAVYFGFGGLLVITSLTPWITGAVLLGAWFAACLLVGRFGPIETKVKWWQP